MKTRLLLMLFTLLLPLCVSAQQRYVVTTQKLNVRAAASAKAKVVGSVYEDDIVIVYSINNGWAKIDFKNQKRYISSKYISKLDSDNSHYSDSDSGDEKQDIIVLKNGQVILGKIIEVNKKAIVYRPENKSSKSNINIAEVQSIRYANGEQRSFSTDLSNNVTNKTIAINEEQNNEQEIIGGLFSLFYLADFNAAGQGHYGFKDDIWWVDKHIGLTFSVGTNLGLVKSEIATVSFTVGPSGIYPVTKSLYLVCPLRFVGSVWTGKDSETKKDTSKFSWGIDLVPGVMFYQNKWSFQLGFDVGWAKGAKKLGTGFMLSIGHDV